MIRNVIFDIGGVFIEWDQNKAFREFGFSDETIRKIQQSMLAPEVWVALGMDAAYVKQRANRISEQLQIADNVRRAHNVQ